MPSWWENTARLRKAARLSESVDFHTLLLALSYSAVSYMKAKCSEKRVKLTNRHFLNAMRTLFLDRTFKKYASLYPPGLQVYLMDYMRTYTYDRQNRSYYIKHRFNDEDNTVRELSEEEKSILFDQINSQIMFSLPRRLKRFVVALLIHLLIHGDRITTDAAQLADLSHAMEKECIISILNVHPDLLNVKTLMYYNLCNDVYSCFWDRDNKGSYASDLEYDESEVKKHGRFIRVSLNFIIPRSRKRDQEAITEKTHEGCVGAV
ncbi:MAG: hypothetical protein KatS3mg087_1142 [Patescibacteria group bacterium]|nr:MAG: hypothetical protein KatS3mg087_1142 [Patescibacteria group bacterium]